MTNLADNWLPRHRLTVEDFHRKNRSLLVFQDPAEENYRVVRSYASPDKISPLLLPGCLIDLSVIF